MSNNLHELMVDNTERLLYLSNIRKAKELRKCFNCDGVIKVNNYFTTATTLLSHIDKVISINNYMLCKTCSIKIDSAPIFAARE